MHKTIAFLTAEPQRQTTSFVCSWAYELVGRATWGRLQWTDGVRPVLAVLQCNRVISLVENLTDGHVQSLLPRLGRSDTWDAALLLAMQFTAAEMGIGADPFIGPPKPAVSAGQIRETRDRLLRQVLKDVPARLATAYRSGIGKPCRGPWWHSRDDRRFEREHLGQIYEAFLSSIVPPFTTIHGAPIDCCCFDLRCEQDFQRDRLEPNAPMAMIFADAHV